MCILLLLDVMLCMFVKSICSNAWFNSNISLLILSALSTADSGVLKYPIIIIMCIYLLRSVSICSIYIGVWVLGMYILMIYLLDMYWPLYQYISVYSVLLCFLLPFLAGSLFCLSKTMPTFFWWNVIFYPFILSLCVVLELKWVH